MNAQYRQGDVFLERVDRIPAGAKSVKRDQRGRVVLALGEQTGHAHALLDRDVELLETGTADSVERFLRVARTEGATVVHEEHATILLPLGEYAVTIQREYLPGAVSRPVSD